MLKARENAKIWGLTLAAAAIAVAAFAWFANRPPPLTPAQLLDRHIQRLEQDIRGELAAAVRDEANCRADIIEYGNGPASDVYRSCIASLRESAAARQAAVQKMRSDMARLKEERAGLR